LKIPDCRERFAAPPIIRRTVVRAIAFIESDRPEGLGVDDAYGDRAAVGGVVGLLADALALLAMNRRVMIQADEALLSRARNVASDRGITFPQLVRQALEHEIDLKSREPLSSTATVESGGAARQREYQPDAWR